MTKTPERILGEQVLHRLQARGPDALERLENISRIASELYLGNQNDDASEDTDPWLIPKSATKLKED